MKLRARFDARPYDVITYLYVNNHYSSPLSPSCKTHVFERSLRKRQIFENLQRERINFQLWESEVGFNLTIFTKRANFKCKCFKFSRKKMLTAYRDGRLLHITRTKRSSTRKQKTENNIHFNCCCLFSLNWSISHRLHRFNFCLFRLHSRHGWD